LYVTLRLRPDLFATAPMTDKERTAALERAGQTEE